MDITYSSPNRRRVIVAVPSKMAEDEFPGGRKKTLFQDIDVKYWVTAERGWQKKTEQNKTKKPDF